MTRWLVTAALLAQPAACGGLQPQGPEAPEIQVGAAAPPRALPPCIPPSDEPIAISHAGVDGTRVRYCVGPGDAQCFALDLESGALVQLRERPPAEPATAHVETVAPELKVCNSQICKSLTPNVLPAAARISAATNADGSVAVFLLGDATAGRGYAEVWDVTHTKKLGTFRYARGEFRCGEVAFVGDTIYVSATQCGAPAGRASLFTLRGRKIADVGARDFGSFGNAFAQIDGSVWGFLEENGGKLVLQDIVKGRVLRTLDTSALWNAGNATMGNPGESAVVRISDTKVAVIAGSPVPGTVATVDVKTGEIRTLRAPICAAPDPAPAAPR